ncbi:MULTISPECIES: methionyl-tRNA formyltransferase [Thermoanaerobacterium]|uniref:Methionyl-tRNA formyltransferase n=1 Tax=Thermoanaerobacterium butyriciformans TaxID=1702242 RepID=A0ABS4NFP8_9THEO|nr:MULTISPECIES: methionyl-tRNA formyltransferase [Thermoanaerobacterium]MBE0068321.1 methionyl-tRNA formyltransferase [Thermoanaerobacterium thermosaccharolyticum]MBE0228185.1 methionyl-tRNA formyltransferase [Thermoanaerobacterium thermosaccharolyticum]MBP2072485.1 methionyl-tRNA formyltransferase [Thermoanaerobacterium butyriciformans]MCP2240343.1 methionyl-tRNA formyltransferase [Thermoanaerobacterium thermosaccharolyticum]WHE08250.1 methionyl-tRNA formyltransferase [Thermoanaerobacterium 
MNIVFMGTPEFAVPSLEKLIEFGHNVMLVITQPDKPRGRGKKISYSPVKECAIKNNIDVFQPQKLKNNKEVFDKLRKLNPDLIVVAAYGKILPEEILQIPRYGCINVHASLLPKYRGAAPINWAVINGEKETGITIMYMEKGLDTGDILLQKSIPILEEDNSETVHDKLAVLGGNALIEAINKMVDGALKPVKQDDSKATYAPILEKSIGLIDWQKSAVEIKNLVRGLRPWPVAYTYYKGNMLKIWAAEVYSYEGKEKPGTVITTGSALIVKCGKDALKILEIQSEGKRRMTVEEFLRGHTIAKGEQLEGI